LAVAGGVVFAAAENWAATAFRAETFTVHAPAPVHEPPQPRKLAPLLGAAVRSTLVPAANVAVHLPGQAIPAGVLVTVPPPRTTTTKVGDVDATAGVTVPTSAAATTTTPAKSFLTRCRQKGTALVIGHGTFDTIAQPPINVYASWMRSVLVLIDM
jgi:hypothetical protein